MSIHLRPRVNALLSCQHSTRTPGMQALTHSRYMVRVEATDLNTIASCLRAAGCFHSPSVLAVEKADEGLNGGGGSLMFLGGSSLGAGADLRVVRRHRPPMQTKGHT